MRGPAVLPLAFWQIIQVIVVAGAAGGALGLQQVLVVNQPDGQALDHCISGLGVGIGEVQTFERGDDVDGHRWAAEREHVEVGAVQEVFGRHAEGRHAKMLERLDQQRIIIDRFLDPDIQVAGGAALAVQNNRIAAHQHIAHLTLP